MNPLMTAVLNGDQRRNRWLQVASVAYLLSRVFTYLISHCSTLALPQAGRRAQMHMRCRRGPCPAPLCPSGSAGDPLRFAHVEPAGRGTTEFIYSG